MSGSRLAGLTLGLLEGLDEGGFTGLEVTLFSSFSEF